MYLANPWGLLGLIAVPAILYIHLFRRRYPPREIAGLFLWLAPRLETPSGQRKEKLPVTLSLLLELLAAAIVTALLCDVRRPSEHEVHHFVFVLDNSASMAAVDGNGKSAAQKAVEFAVAQMAGVPRARGTAIVSGDHPAILGRAKEEERAFREIFDAYRPTLPDHDLARALALAVDIAGAAGEVFCLTDHLPDRESVPANAAVVAFGEPVPNIGFTGAEWLRPGSGAGKNLFLRVGNFSTQGVETKVVGFAGEEVVFTREVELGPKQQAKVVLRAPEGIGEISFRLPPDSLDLDNTATVVSPPRRAVRVANWLKDEQASAPLDRALRAMDHVTVFVGSREAHLRVAPPARYAPEEDASWWLVVGPLTKPHRAEGEPKNLLGPFLIERAHPLVEGVTLGGVIWPGAAPGGQGLTPIVSGADILLIGLVSSSPARTYWLNIDLPRSNITRSPDWPVLLNNLIELRRQALPGLRRRAFHTGESVEFVNPVPGAKLRLERPDGSEGIRAGTKDVVLPRLSAPGVYRLLVGEKLVEHFSVNVLDARESDLTGLAKGRMERLRATESVSLSVAERPHRLNFLLGLLVLGAVLWNWRLAAGGDETGT